MRRLAKPVSSDRGSEGSNPSLSATGETNMADGSRSQRSAIAVAAVLLAGCAAKRELVVTSDPPGATVRLDERIVGVTPYRERFDAYGRRRVTVYLDGYRTSSKRVKLRPPWYARFPIDFFSEVVFPVGWRDTQFVHVDLAPESGEVTEGAVANVLENATRLRFAGPDGPGTTVEEGEEALSTPPAQPSERDRREDP